MRIKKNILLIVVATSIALFSCNLEMNKKNNDNKEEKKEIPFQLPRLF